MTLMLMFLIILAAIAGIALSSYLLLLFVRKGLKGDLKRFSRAMVGLLILQFIFGMTANLFATIPKVMPWLVFHELGPILVHAALATFLLILAIIFRVDAGRAGKYEKAAAIGGVSIAVAFVSGVVFVNLGQNNWFSLAMSVAFISAFTAYCSVVFSSNDRSEAR